jgi:uncharacterized membrane protein
MHFASPFPWWLAVLTAVGIAGIAVLSYRRPLVPLSLSQRATLIAVRALALGLPLLFLYRPVVVGSRAPADDLAIAVLVDISRSMRIADADGKSRISRAAELLQNQVLPALARHGTPELYGVGNTLVPLSPDRLSAEASASNLTGAIAAIRDRYRGRQLAGIVVLSDGGNTGDPVQGVPAGRVPIYAVGIGSADGIPDREVLALAAGDPRIDQTSVDLHVSAVSRGLGREPFQLRLLANGRLLDTRRVAPRAEGSPTDEILTVFPDPATPTVYTAEIVSDSGEQISENNRRSVLVSPSGRKRRVLAIEGAPGFEHSFLTRALTRDPSLEVDSVVRKGRNEAGESTFVVQAAGARSAALTSGFPTTREALYAYDALIIANVEGDFFKRSQLAMTADFVSQRGGGLVVLGGRSFAQRGMIGTPLEEVLPLELNDRRGNRVGTAGDDATPSRNAVRLTAEGESHPITRIGTTPEESKKVWAALPALASTSLLGGPRPGASVLAVTSGPSGVVPVVAVQRYGRGRSMIFAGEASWRWKMMLPATDRSYEFFWRQSVRWLSTEAPDPLEISIPESPEPGDVVPIDVEVRDQAFAPVTDAAVSVTITPENGETATVSMRPSRAPGRFVGTFTATAPGMYHVSADVRRGSTRLGSAERWSYAGGVDKEFVDPRLNEGFLRRLARDSGGQYSTAADVGRTLAALPSAAPSNAEPQTRDLWHGPSTFMAVIALLSVEWLLRRRWGLR